jgi:hypothetical protein
MKSFLLSYAVNSPDAVTSRGCKLYGHLAKSGSGAYFHYVFPPLSGSIMEKYKDLIPFDVLEFLHEMNGGIFFDKCLNIFGLTEEIFSTGTIDDVQPISILDKNMGLRYAVVPDELVVGSVIAEDRHNIVYDVKTGVVRIECAGRRGGLSFPSLEAAFAGAADIVAKNVTYGVPVSDAQRQTIERSLTALLSE